MNSRQKVFTYGNTTKRKNNEQDKTNTPKIRDWRQLARAVNNHCSVPETWAVAWYYLGRREAW